VFCVETGGTRIYSEAAFEAGDALVFGPETRGLPGAVMDRIPVERRLYIPNAAG